MLIYVNFNQWNVLNLRASVEMIGYHAYWKPRLSVNPVLSRVEMGSENSENSLSLLYNFWTTYENVMKLCTDIPLAMYFSKM